MSRSKTKSLQPVVSIDTEKDLENGLVDIESVMGDLAWLSWSCDRVQGKGQMDGTC
jgi:hypothetical protein